MKKILLTLSVLLSFSTQAFAETISPPRWNEFCPAAYVNAKPSRFNNIGNYWYNRRIQFEESLSQCNYYKGERLKSCYSQIRNAEYNKNKSSKAGQTGK